MAACARGCACRCDWRMCMELVSAAPLVYPSPMTLFVGTGLTCLRGDRLVFAGLDFAVAAGGALLLQGPNGSGKSSLLRMMAGLIPPYAGTIALDGADIRRDPEAHRAAIAYLGHADAIKPALSVQENLAVWAGLSDRPGDLGHALAAVELADIADRTGRFLSSGQRRRLALARLLAAPARIWLADEPTVGLDAASVARFEAMLAAHRAEGGAVVASTHLPFALPGAERLDLADFTILPDHDDPDDPAQASAAEATP